MGGSGRQWKAVEGSTAAVEGSGRQWEAVKAVGGIRGSKRGDGGKGKRG